MNTNSSTGAKLSTNVGKLERIGSILAGTALMFKGFKNNKSKLNIPIAIAGGYLLYRGATGHCDLYSIAGKEKLPDTVKKVKIRTENTGQNPRQEVYNFWRKLSNLPKFMKHLENVEVIDDVRSHWTAKMPVKLEWDAEVVKEINGELIGWNSLPNASIHNAGKVEFFDTADGGTLLKVVITYRPPFGDIGEGIASLFNKKFERMIEEDILAFKTYIETGANMAEKHF